MTKGFSTTSRLAVFTHFAFMLAAGMLLSLPGQGQPFNAGVRPQLVNLSGRPGTIGTFNIYLRNYEKTRTVTLYLGTADAVQEAHLALSFGEPGVLPFSCAKWMQLEKTKVDIPPDAEVKIRVNVRVPVGNIAGSYHGIITMSGMPPGPAKVPDGAQAVAAFRVSFGVIVHFNVPGTLIDDAEIQSIGYSDAPQPGSGYTRATAPAKRWITLKVANKGNSLLYSYGTVVMRSAQGYLYDRWRIGKREEGEKVVIYPGRTVELYLPLKKALPPGDYQVEARVTYGKGKTEVGTVPITVKAVEGDQAVVETSGFKPYSLSLSLLVDQEFKELQVARGALRTNILNVTNNEAFPLSVHPEAMDVKMDADGVITPYLREDADPERTGRWLRVPGVDFVINPGETRKVQYSVTVPRDGSITQDLVGFIKFTARKIDRTTREKAKEQLGETGTLIIATPTDVSSYKAEMQTPKLDTPPIQDAPMRLGIPVKNTGTVHINPTGSIAMTGITTPGFSWESSLLPAGNSGPLILPGATRTIWVPLPQKELKTGDYQVVITINYANAAPLVMRAKIHLAPETEEAPPATPAPTPVP